MTFLFEKVIAIRCGCRHRVVDNGCYRRLLCWLSTLVSRVYRWCHDCTEPWQQWSI